VGPFSTRILAWGGSGLDEEYQTEVKFWYRLTNLAFSRDGRFEPAIIPCDWPVYLERDSRATGREVCG
jgi:hypothetical protein